ncbi:MAG: hypothetical protein ABIK08_11270 [Pseudomonadota bacterium]
MSAADLEQPTVDLNPAEWEQDVNADTDTWNRRSATGTRCHISQYAGSDRYFWQTVRGDFRISGAVLGRLAAMNAAEETMALPVEEFNRQVTADLIDDLRRIERDILRLSPNTEILPGYHAGYEAGVADIKRRIEAAIGLGEEKQS